MLNSIIIAPYKNISTELWFDAIPLGGLRKEKHLLVQGFNIIQEDLISIHVFLICLNFFFLYSQHHYFYNQVFPFNGGGRRKVGAKISHIITHWWLYRKPKLIIPIFRRKWEKNFLFNFYDSLSDNENFISQHLFLFSIASRMFTNKLFILDIGFICSSS